jgi:predicted nucleic acid-binding protein
MRLFLDANVVLDILARREPHFFDSVQILSLVESGAAEGFIAAHTVTTLFYLLHRKIGPARTKATLMDLLRVLRIVPVDHDRILQAFAMEWDDLEDALQAACAAKAEAEYLLTRDRRGFAAADVMALSPAEFLALYRGRDG